MFQVEQLENALWEPVSFTAEAGMTMILSGDKEALTELAGYLAGYRVAPKGTVTVDGQEADGTCVGYMPAGAPVYEDMTISQWLEFMAQLKGKSEAEAAEQAQEILQTYGEEELDGKLCKAQNKLAALLQTLTGNPKMLVLDQPAEGLNEEAMQEMYDRIQKIAEAYPVILLIADPAVAEMMEGTLYLFHDGILKPVTVEELHADHAELYQEMLKEQLREEDDLAQILEDYEGGSQYEKPNDEK